jgi:4-amino-4-deoxy-L-arabinose transferase-like glycosyltransferase
MLSKPSIPYAVAESRSIPYVTFSLVLIAVLTLFRFWFCQQLELVGDEAYYWVCSRHLDWSFFDKGPGAALTIALGTRLFGDTVFGIRFFAVMLSLGTGLAIYALARTLFSERAAFWSVVLANVIPLFAVGGILMTIDPLSVFFWTLAALSFWKAKSGDGWWLWLLTGALVGLGALAKYTNYVELLCFVLFCLWSRPQRVQFKRLPFYAMLASAVVCSLPILIWNAQHQWITVFHLLHRGAINGHWQFNPGQLLTFIGMQAGVISPLIFVGVLVAVFCRRWRALSEQSCFLIALFLPLIVLYVGLSSNHAGEPNWTAPAYVSGLILLAAHWPEFRARHPAWKWLAPVGIALGLVETVLLHHTAWLHLPPDRDPLNRARGFEPVALQAAVCAGQTKADFYIADKYSTASLLAFYLPGQPDTFMPPSDEIENQYSIWPGYGAKFPPGATGLFVSSIPKLKSSWTHDFTRVDLVQEMDATDHGRTIAKYYLFRCEGLGQRKTR